MNAFKNLEIKMTKDKGRGIFTNREIFQNQRLKMS